MTVPVGHSQPPATQTARQGLGVNLLIHVLAQLGLAAQSLLTCPCTEHAKIENSYTCICD